ncbi:CBS domain-containing protein [Streptomyces sp. TR06-5]|uniref:CBS domain-containing protein n=1 Tax=unclassified Streptomyces TaxID=2593676 RepID=UPI0039A29C37
MNRSPHVVNDVMSQPVVAVGAEASFKEIAEALERWQVSAVPVLEGDGRVVGVVSEADLLPTEGARDDPSSPAEEVRRADEPLWAGALTARDLMSAPAVSVRADATLPQAARAMARRRLKRLPVVDVEGHLVGMVSRSDLLKVFLRSDRDIEQEVREQVVRPLFPAAPAPEVRVEEGIVTFTGSFGESSLVPLAARMTRSVEGVVDVEFRLAPPDAGRAPGDGEPSSLAG